MEQPFVIRRSVEKCKNGVRESIEDEVVREYPLTIYVNEEEFATIVCSPQNLEEMVIGFLGSEGMIRFFHKDVKSIEIDQERGFAYVSLTKSYALDQQFYSKRYIGSCCGKSRQSFYFLNDAKQAKTSMTKMTLTVEQCTRLMELMQNESDVFKQTGGVHNAALAQADKLLLTRTDIGRHNALDKIYGHCLKGQLSLRDKVLVFSGRLSSEVLLKAAKMGVGIMLSKSAPTDLALRMAEELQITAVGFIRGQNMNIYTHGHRIISASEQ